MPRHDTGECDLQSPPLHSSQRDEWRQHKVNPHLGYKVIQMVPQMILQISSRPVANLLPSIRSWRGSHTSGLWSSRLARSHHPGERKNSQLIPNIKWNWKGTKHTKLWFGLSWPLIRFNGKTWCKFWSSPALQAVTIKGRCTAMSMAVIAAAWFPIIAWHDASSCSNWESTFQTWRKCSSCFFGGASREVILDTMETIHSIQNNIYVPYKRPRCPLGT